MNTLTQFFDWLLAASFRASLLTAATLLLQMALHRHLSARMRYALWLPVLVVLLMPVLPQSRWSIEQVFHAAPQPTKIIPMVSTMLTEPVVLTAPAPMPEPINWQRLILMSWAVVSAGILVLGGISFALTLRRFKQARHPASEDLLATLAEIASEVRLRQMPQILIASSVSSPAVTGLLRPTLLLPAQFDREFTPAEARLVLKHELMHLKRGDLPLNALMCVLMALHWFNPLLWIAFFKIRADREAACDAQVLRDASKDHRAEYGHALLKVETAFCPRGLSLGFVGIFQRGSSLRSRIQSIASHHHPHPTMKAIITLCIVLMTFFGVTRAQRPEPVRDFTLGQASFRSGDSIRINSVQTTAETITVAVDYELASEEETSIALFITTKDSGPTPVDPRQRALIKKGKGSLVLVHPHPQPGMPHVTFYSKAGKSIGGIYFGTQEQAAASKNMKLNYMTSSAQEEIVITAQQTSIDPVTKIQTAKGDARCKVGEISIQAAELVRDPKAQQLRIRGPFTLMLGSEKKHSSTSAESSAVLDLATGKLTTSGSHVTEIITSPAKNQAAAQPSNPAAAKAAELRKAPARRYDFSKAVLGDVLRYLATDAGMNFISLSEDNPTSNRLITFSLNANPFEALETICRANGLVMGMEQGRWFFRDHDDKEVLVKSYALNKPGMNIDILTNDIELLLSSGDAKSAVAFNKDTSSFKITTTRLQHSWVSAYFQGLNTTAQSASVR